MYGKRIREIRIEKGLSQKDFAKIVGTTQENISKYELEKLDLNTEIIIQICTYFNVSADYLLGLEDIAGTKYNSSFINSFNGVSGKIDIR